MENNMEMIENVTENVEEVAKHGGKVLDYVGFGVIGGCALYGGYKLVDAGVKGVKKLLAKRKKAKAAKEDTQKQTNDDDFDIDQPIDAK